MTETALATEFVGYDAYDRRKRKREGTFVPLTKTEVLALSYNDHPLLYYYRDQVVTRVKVNGKVRTWKTRPDQIEVPVKYGMYSHATLEYNGVDRTGNATVVLVRQVGDWREPDGEAG